MTLDRSFGASNSGPLDPGSTGLRLTAECRAYLRAGLPDAGAAEGDSGGGLWSQHLQLCAFCSSRLAAKQKLASALRSVPPVPQELHSPAFLDGIRTRIIEQSERSPVGALLDRAMPVVVPDHVEGAFPQELLQSDLSRAAIQRGEPARDSDFAWSRVRTHVFAGLGDEVAQARQRHRLLRTKGIALASVAAAAIICAMLVSEGTTTQPTIVITDVATMPSVEFSPMAVLRHGTNK